MEKLLIYLKHHFPFIWRFLEGGNDLVFSLVFAKRMNLVSGKVLKDKELSSFSFRKLIASDAGALEKLIHSQSPGDLKYFSPHAFDMQSLKRQFRKRSFLMMGAFAGDHLVGYFFLRFFLNRKCFVGRLIDHTYRGKGIGQVMNTIMYTIAWDMNFRCLSTISRNNVAVMKAHAKNDKMIVRKELANDFLLVEFVDENEQKA